MVRGGEASELPKVGKNPCGGFSELPKVGKDPFGKL